MSKRRVSSLVAAVALLAAGAALTGCCHDRKPANTSQSAVQPKTTLVNVHANCSLDVTAPIELSKAGADRVHWALEGGTGKLDVVPKAAAAQDTFGRDLVLRCPGAAECWAQVTPNAEVGDQLEYRLVIDGQQCPDPMIIIKP